MDPILLFWVLLMALVGYIIVRVNCRQTTVPDGFAGLHYSKGIYRNTLATGRHWLIGTGQRVDLVDLRERSELFAGQEVVSSDGAPVKISFVLQYRIADPRLFTSSASDARQSMYLQAQAVLRDAVAGRDMEAVLAARIEIAEEIKVGLAALLPRYGMELIDVFIRDLMLSGPLHSVFTRVLAAKREGQIALEKARAESAAVRSLLNTAQLLERNPQLMQLRLLQAMKDSSGNTFILKLPGSHQLAGLAGDSVQAELDGEE